jgi:hypothetical protein
MVDELLKGSMEQIEVEIQTTTRPFESCKCICCELM